MLKYLLHRFGRFYVDRLCRTEFADQAFRRVNERPVEFSFVFRKLAELNPEQSWTLGPGLRHCSLDSTLWLSSYCHR